MTDVIKTELTKTELAKMGTAATVAVDPICAAAIDLAVNAALEIGGPEAVGPHQDIIAESDLVATHVFACTLPGYLGWAWQVVVSRAPRSRRVTVSEVDLLPTDTALQAPSWLPWTERIEPGDLSAGNVVATDPQDARLAPGWSGEEDLAGELDPAPLHPVNWEPGLGRPRVPSLICRTEATDRWYRGEHGPLDPIAKGAPGACGSCGWLLTMGGPIGQVFGVCTNMLSPSDGSVVSFDHGCGGHSEATPDSSSPNASVVIDDHLMDDLDMGHS